jgi:hypothetical protein
MRRRDLLTGAGALAVAGCARQLMLTQDVAGRIKRVLPVVSFDETLAVEYSSGTIMLGTQPLQRVLLDRTETTTAWGMNARAAAVLAASMPPGIRAEKVVQVAPALRARADPTSTSRVPDPVMAQRLAALPEVADARAAGSVDAIMVVATTFGRGRPHRGLHAIGTFGATLITVNRLVFAPLGSDLSLAYVVMLYEPTELAPLAFVLASMPEDNEFPMGTVLPRATLDLVWRGGPWPPPGATADAQLREAAHRIIEASLPTCFAGLGLVPAPPSTRRLQLG